MLWVSDFTHVSIWQGVVYVAFIIDTFADKIVGWRVSNSPKTDFLLDTLEKTLHDRRPVHKLASVTTLTAAGSICPFAIPNDWRILRSIPQLAALAIPMTPPWPRPINGLYKAEVIHRLEHWKTMAAVEWETIK
jgi:putative transposase